VDATFHDHNHITYFACCVRDSRGQFIQAQTKWQRTNITVLEGEAVVLLETLHFADSNRWDRVVFKSNSSTLVQAISSLGHGDSEFYVIVSSTIYQLSLHSNFEMKLVRRQANMVAHTLTRAACSWTSHCIFYSYPSCIKHFLDFSLVIIVISIPLYTLCHHTSKCYSILFWPSPLLSSFPRENNPTCGAKIRQSMWGFLEISS